MIEIERANLLTALFGHWPSFHDAEVLSMRLAARGDGAPSLEVEFEVAEMSPETDDRGYYRDRCRARVHVRFSDLRRVQLHGFLYQNVLTTLQIEESGPEVYDEWFGPDEPQGRRR